MVSAAGESVEEFQVFCASVSEEFGPEGIDAYVEVKSVTLPFGA